MQKVEGSSPFSHIFFLQNQRLHQDYESLDGALFDRVLVTQRPNHIFAPGEKARKT
jgi:hypothetical protein